MKRRDFIVKGGLVSAGVVAGTSAIWGLSNSLGSNGVINVGVVGTGARGSGLIPLLNQIKEVNVAACCDAKYVLLDILHTSSQVYIFSNYRCLILHFFLRVKSFAVYHYR